ncbi:MAG: hypothetical protein FWF03_06120, partial [Defluviitaleaceae bacterium]|nr:hypothetical protein [Defluviitaleaceae bacterium]
MSKKFLTVAAAAIVFAAAAAIPAGAKGGEVAVSVPVFDVKLNGIEYGGGRELYPLLVYRDITYFPMTYHLSNLLNLNTSWTEEDGLNVAAGNPGVPKVFAPGEINENGDAGRLTAKIAGSRITVNGKTIDNSAEPFPILFFRDITYFPLTWRFAFDEFGWSYLFDEETGLTIWADNYFYTANGDSSAHIDEDGAIYTSV